MKISYNSVCLNNNSCKTGKPAFYPVKNGYCQDTTCFTGLKKSAFKGVDFAVIEKYKACIEKFKTVDDLQNWAAEQILDIKKKDFAGRNYDIIAQRQDAVKNWIIELNNENCTEVEKFLILKGITKDLKPNDETRVPIFNRKVLKESLDELKSELDKDSKYQFDFGKIYKTNLRKFYSKSSEADSNSTKWVIIPSKNNDAENYKQNIEKLQTLSHGNWCTKNGGAKLYLESGDIHIYLENGAPKIAVRFDDEFGMIMEINGELNDKVIEKDYIKIIDDYINENKYSLSREAERTMDGSKVICNYQEVTKPSADTSKTDNISKKASFFSNIKQFFGIK